MYGDTPVNVWGHTSSIGEVFGVRGMSPIWGKSLE
jgi:hypothetical protein